MAGAAAIFYVKTPFIHKSKVCYGTGFIREGGKSMIYGSEIYYAGMCYSILLFVDDIVVASI